MKSGIRAFGQYSSKRRAVKLAEELGMLDIAEELREQRKGPYLVNILPSDGITETQWHNAMAVLN